MKPIGLKTLAHAVDLIFRRRDPAYKDASDQELFFEAEVGAHDAVPYNLLRFSRRWDA